MSDEWETFLAEHGEDIASTVQANMRREANMFDIEDGTHAGWCGDRLGILVGMPAEDAGGESPAAPGVTDTPPLETPQGKPINQLAGASPFPRPGTVQEPMRQQYAAMQPQGFQRRQRAFGGYPGASVYGGGGGSGYGGSYGQRRGF